jgi:ubiquinone/menaquinone biosynthesis C-methylase UbiE
MLLHKLFYNYYNDKILVLENIEQKNYWNNTASQKWIKEYDSIKYRLKEVTDHFFKILPKLDNFKILDVGCGTGETLLSLSKLIDKNSKVTAIDISQSMIEFAKNKLSAQSNFNQYAFVVDDAQTHIFNKNYYDLIISRFGMMFFSDPLFAFKNIYNSLKFGGEILFCTWSGIKDNDFFGIPLITLSNYLDVSIPNFDNQPGPMSLSEPRLIRSLLEHSGFNDVEVITKKVNLMGLENLDQQLFILLNIGPTGRLFKESKLDQDKKKISILKEQLKKNLKNRIHKNELILSANVHFVCAKK